MKLRSTTRRAIRSGASIVVALSLGACGTVTVEDTVQPMAGNNWQLRQAVAGSPDKAAVQETKAFTITVYAQKLTEAGVFFVGPVPAAPVNSAAAKVIEIPVLIRSTSDSVSVDLRKAEIVGTDDKGERRVYAFTVYGRRFTAGQPARWNAPYEPSTVRNGEAHVAYLRLDADPTKFSGCTLRLAPAILGAPDPVPELQLELKRGPVVRGMAELARDAALRPLM